MMVKITIIFYLLCIFGKSSLACTGCVNLDELTFEKTISKFKTSLVKFDQSFPFGESHEAYAKFAQHISNLSLSETISHSEVLIATVGVKDYGELENQKLAEKYGIKIDSFPVIKLFNNGNLEQPINFVSGEEKLTVSSLYLFLKQYSSTYIKAPGCVEDLDMLAQEFSTQEVLRKSILQKATDAIARIECEKKRSITEFYETLMKNIILKGNEFIALQHDRMTRLLNDKISEKKSEEIAKKLNILMSFQKYITVTTTTTNKNEL